MTATELARLADNRLHPGMPAEAFISTGDPSALSCFLKFFEQQLARAFREN